MFDKRCQSRPLPALAGVLACALLAANAALAGPIDPGHTLERVGAAPARVVAAAVTPGVGRFTTLDITGGIRLIAGDGLVSELLHTLPVHNGCGTPSLSLAWNPTSSGSELLASYVAQGTQRLTVERLEFSQGRLVASQPIFDVDVAPSCTNLGGGLAFDGMGRFLLGVGDHGDAAGSADTGSLLGKVLRLNTDGSIPADNPGGSAILASGLRDPKRLATDFATGESFILDIGPLDNDEINQLIAGAAYGWPTGAGQLLTPGLEDPVHTFAPTSTPTALVVNTGDDLSDAWGDLVVALSGGRLVQLRDPIGGVTEEVLLLTPEAAEPTAYVDALVGHDGHVYMFEDLGVLHRFLRKSEPLTEPSSARSVIPLLVSKGTAGGLDLSAERRPDAQDMGVYIGALGAGGPTHPETSDLIVPVDANTDDATTRLSIDEADITSRGGTASYVLVSARGTSVESGLGETSDSTERPGGKEELGGCTGECVGNVGRFDGDCAPEFTLAAGIEGAGNVIGPANFFADYTCQVILIHIGAEW